MNDLISRSALLEATANFCDGYKVNWSDKKVLAWINAAPAVDAVEVVRCAQCVHFGHNLENDTYCSSVNGLTDPEEDDFCSYGERRNGDAI